MCPSDKISSELLSRRDLRQHSARPVPVLVGKHQHCDSKHQPCRDSKHQHLHVDLKSDMELPEDINYLPFCCRAAALDVDELFSSWGRLLGGKVGGATAVAAGFAVLGFASGIQNAIHGWRNQSKYHESVKQLSDRVKKFPAELLSNRLTRLTQDDGKEAIQQKRQLHNLEARLCRENQAIDLQRFIALAAGILPTVGSVFVLLGLWSAPCAVLGTIFLSGYCFCHVWRYWVTDLNWVSTPWYSQSAAYSSSSGRFNPAHSKEELFNTGFKTFNTMQQKRRLLFQCVGGGFAIYGTFAAVTVGAMIGSCGLLLLVSSIGLAVMSLIMCWANNGPICAAMLNTDDAFIGSETLGTKASTLRSLGLLAKQEKILRDETAKFAQPLPYWRQGLATGYTMLGSIVNILAIPYLGKWLIKQGHHVIRNYYLNLFQPFNLPQPFFEKPDCFPTITELTHLREPLLKGQMREDEFSLKHAIKNTDHKLTQAKTLKALWLWLQQHEVLDLVLQRYWQALPVGTTSDLLFGVNETNNKFLLETAQKILEKPTLDSECQKQFAILVAEIQTFIYHEYADVLKGRQRALADQLIGRLRTKAKARKNRQ